MNPRLVEILRTMDIPVFRQGDIRWLGRNLGTLPSHRSNPDFDEAIKLMAGTISPWFALFLLFVVLVLLAQCGIHPDLH